MPDAGQARDHAAAAFHVSPRLAEAAASVLRRGTPELIVAVDAGRAAVSTAAILAEATPDQQRVALAGGRAEVAALARRVRRRRAERLHAEKLAEVARRSIRARSQQLEGCDVTGTELDRVATPVIARLITAAARRYMLAAGRQPTASQTLRKAAQKAPRGPEQRVCPIPGCGKPGRGPRYRWLCDEHRETTSRAEWIRLKRSSDKRFRPRRGKR